MMTEEEMDAAYEEYEREAYLCSEYERYLSQAYEQWIREEIEKTEEQDDVEGGSNPGTGTGRNEQ